MCTCVCTHTPHTCVAHCDGSTVSNYRRENVKKKKNIWYVFVNVWHIELQLHIHSRLCASPETIARKTDTTKIHMNEIQTYGTLTTYRDMRLNNEKISQCISNCQLCTVYRERE